MSEHTKEPWVHDGFFVLLGREGGFSLSGCPSPEANARRIVACVNACEGIGTEYLEKFSATTFNDFKRMKEQRDELLAALMEVLERMEQPPARNCSCHLSPPCNDCVEFSGIREAIEFAESAIAKVQK